jgi:hypothetical protein
MPGRLQKAGCWTAKHLALTGFVVVFAASVVVGLIQGPKLFVYDSANYWELSETFNHNGHFSFLHYEYLGIRGYAMPLTFYLLHEVGSLFGSAPSTDVVVFNSALFALTAAVLGPSLVAVAWPERRWGLLPRLGVGALFLIFWSGYLNYPLSDFPALVAAVLTVVAVSHWRSPAWLGLAGFSAAYAVDARPAYLLLIPLGIMVVAYSWWRDRDKARFPAGRRLACVVTFVVGLALVSAPQSLVEHHYGYGLSPLPGGNTLAGLQYTEGLRLQRYETFIGSSLPSMDYLDPHGEALLAELEGGEVENTSQYAEIILHHPVTIAGVFLRHVVNGLDQRYTTPYVERLEPPARKILRLAGFLLVFLAAFRLLWPRGRRSLGAASWPYPAMLLLCCLTVLPSAVETRFMLPVFLLSSLVVLTAGWPSPLEAGAIGLRRFRTLTVGVVALVVYLVVVDMIVSATTNHLVLA